MIQSLLNGVVDGLLLAVVGLAFSLVYATTRVFHIALGAIYTAAPYLLLAALHGGLHWSIGLGCAVFTAVGLGLAAEELMHWPLERRRAPSDVHFISSLGAFLVITRMVVLIWGNDAKVLSPGIDTVYSFAGLRVTAGQAIGAAVATAGLTGTFVWLRWSEVGLQFRALASNAPLLATLGRDIRALRRGVFGISAALVALMAVVKARDVGFDPNVGMGTVLLGVVATIVGGRFSFLGAAAAGLLLGVLRAQVAWLAGARWEDASTFALLAAFLLLAPGGLRSVSGGTSRIEEAR